MKIRNLLVLATTMVLGTLGAQAQERDGSMTFTDHMKQSITVSSFGTVLSFRNSKGRETAQDSAYKVCPCGSSGKCIEWRNAPIDGISSELTVENPQQGMALDQEQTLVVTATVRQGELTLTRRLSWLAGSRVYTIDETISSSVNMDICLLKETAKTLTSATIDFKMKPPPPGGKAKSPCIKEALDKMKPPPPGGDSLKVRPGQTDLVRPLPICPDAWFRLRSKHHLTRSV